MPRSHQTGQVMMDVEKAMKNPATVFGTPEVLNASTELTAGQKHAILLQWKDQLQQLQAADDESMQGADGTAGANAECLRRVTSTLSRLDAERAAKPA
jgi:hypothetical protein